MEFFNAIGRFIGGIFDVTGNDTGEISQTKVGTLIATVAGLWLLWETGDYNSVAEFLVNPTVAAILGLNRIFVGGRDALGRANVEVVEEE